MNDVPLFPLNTVLFPGGRLPLRIFEQRYMEMAKTCLRDGSPFGVCLIREGKEVGSPATPVEIGCLARIAAWDMPQLGLLHITAVGEQRFRLVERRVQPNGLARGSIELLGAGIDGPVPENCAGCVKLLERVIEQHPALFEPPHQLDSASWVSSRLAEILPLSLPTKQELLELADARVRIERLNALLCPPTERT
jgi:Lon protease-like protein